MEIVIFILAGVAFVLALGVLLGWSWAEAAAYDRDKRLVAAKRQLDAQWRALQTAHEIHELFWQSRRAMEREHQQSRPVPPPPFIVEGQVITNDGRYGPWND